MDDARAIMADFADRTGLTSARPQRRYLWTDAFAVCNWLGIAAAESDPRALALALQLVERVHEVLGRFRPDDSRRGWISGLGESEGALHPTVGGLRIGKALPERGRDEPFDERLEWERDGQYFHYLTQWMHALDRVAIHTGDPRFNVWARELAHAACEAFVFHGAGRDRPRMAWKMSTDLSRPLVAAMGQHDPLDGFITCVALQRTAVALGGRGTGPDLGRAIDELAGLLEGGELRTADPLGLGGLLTEAFRLAHLISDGALPPTTLLERLLDAASDGLAVYARGGEWRQPASRRLPFRELGLAIGLAAIERLRLAGLPEAERIEGLAGRSHLGSAIVSFWREPENRAAATWSAHADINDVMLATALSPDGFLG